MAPATPEPITCSPPLSDIDDPRSFWLEAQYQGQCAHCGRIKGAWQAHHVVFRQTCRREGAPEWSPDDAIRVCAGAPDRCHEREHSGQERLKCSDLRDENIAFAVRWLGPGAAFNYLVRYYEDDGDPRVHHLLGIA